MAEAAPKILLVDDEERFLESISKRMRLLGFEPLTATHGLAAIETARHSDIDLAVVDLRMPDMDGLVTIAKLKEIHPDLRTVLLTAHGDEKVKQAIPHLEFHAIDEAGHVPHYERPEAVNPILTDFLQRKP